MAGDTNSESNTSPQTFSETDEYVNLVGEICMGNKEIVNVELPEDLVVEILLKLPVKSLIRFKTVCKPWKLLIDSRVFVNNHLHRKNPERGLFPLKAGEGNPCQGDDDTLPSKIVYIAGSCNGIICFKTTNRQNPLVLYNPSTKESCLVPNECSGYHVYGFCYISQTHEYKVLCIKNLHPVRCDIDTRIMTLGMKTKSIRDVKNIMLPAELYHCTPERNSVTCGSSIFWLGNIVDDDDFDNIIPIVMCYDAFEDKFSTITVPLFPMGSDVDRDMIDRHLSVYKNSVIMFVQLGDDVTFFDIWILINDEGSKDKSWMKYRKIRPLETCAIIRPIHVSRNDRWILCSKSESLEHTSNNLFYYDLETNQVEDYTEANQETELIEFENYVESLVSPKSICFVG